MNILADKQKVIDPKRGQSSSCGSYPPPNCILAGLTYKINIVFMVMILPACFFKEPFA